MTTVEGQRPVPFDFAKLDHLLDAEDIDILIITSKHNVQYLLGGYRFPYFTRSDAVGSSRYLPVLIYQKGRLDHAAYIGCTLEQFEKELGAFWTPVVHTCSFGSADAMLKAVEHIRAIGGTAQRIGIEPSFLPSDADSILRREMPCELVDAHFPLERLRCQKTPRELALMAQAVERVLRSLAPGLQSCQRGVTKRYLAEALRREQTSLGLAFEYCFISAGTSLNRIPSDQQLENGDVVSIECGATFEGYFANVSRMAMLGDPDCEIQGRFREVVAIQQSARRPIRDGVRGAEIFMEVEKLIKESVIVITSSLPLTVSV